MSVKARHVSDLTGDYLDLLENCRTYEIKSYFRYDSK